MEGLGREGRRMGETTIEFRVFCPERRLEGQEEEEGKKGRDGLGTRKRIEDLGRIFGTFEFTFSLTLLLKVRKRFNCTTRTHP